MGGRLSYLWPTLMAVACGLLSPGDVAAADVDRLTFSAEPKSPCSIHGSEAFTWQNGSEKVFLIRGLVLEQDGTTIKADQAIVWQVSEAVKANNPPVRLTVYAKGGASSPVEVKRPSGTVTTHKALFTEFTTPLVGRLSGVVTPRSMANSDLFKEALTARGTPELAPANDLILPTQFAPPPGGPKGALPPPPALDPPLLKGTTVIPIPLTEERTMWIAPRSTQPYEIRMTLIGTERVTVVTGGVKMLAKFSTGSIRSLEVEADQLVIWRKGGDSKSAVDAMKSAEGSDSEGLEFYMSGNVVLRYGGDADALVPGGPVVKSKTLRAERVYYDVEKHRAVATHADLEFLQEGKANKAHVLGETINQLGAGEFQAVMATLHSSRHPSDPGLIVSMATAHIYKMPRAERRTIFGAPFRDRETGEIVEEDPTIFEADDVTTRVEGVPVFYKSHVKTDINDPFGPFKGVTFRKDNQFGFQAFLTWDMRELAGITKIQGETWDLLTDYLSLRGPAVGTNYSLTSSTFLGMDAPFQTLVKAYVISDAGKDKIAGARTEEFQPTALRGRLLWRHQQEFDDLTWQSQLAYLSDRNFYEQYYNFDYNQGPNQETFLWLKYQTGNAAATLLTEPAVRRGVSETNWLPKVEGHLLGVSPFDFLTYSTWGSAAYAKTDPFRQPASEFPQKGDTNQPPREFPVSTGRFDWMHELSMPLYAGPVKVVPYGVADLAYYTSDVNSNGRGRAYGGLGVRASLPMSHLYRDVESELFNVQGLYHKNVFSLNYYHAASTLSQTLLPQLDRLNDDATESAYRNITPYHPFFAPTIGPDGVALASSPVYDPRMYAVRRLVDTKPDTLDDIHVLQTGWRQRFQTKRGYPGLEHEVDWLTVNLTGSIFPTQNRDNFGNSVGFLESDVVWNVGDRNAVFFNSWVDPFDLGANYYALGATYTRDDRTRLSLAYRAIEPLHSRVLSASATYVFNPKYAITTSTAYDFSTSGALSNSLIFTRIGTDMQVSVGFNYNALINNFGFTISIIPNLVANNDTVNGFNQANLGGLGGNRYQDRR